MIFIFLTLPRDLSGVYNRMTANMPTMEQILNYVRENPDCKSKDIAKHFGCTTKDINRNRGEYIGIYSNPAIISTDYKHRVKETVPEPEPEGNVCPICLEPPTNPVSGGCCPYPMCRECFIELKNSDGGFSFVDFQGRASDKCPHCRETFPWAVPDNRARLMPDQDEIDRLRDRIDQLRRFSQAGDERILELERENQSLRDRAMESDRAEADTIPLPEADEEIPMNAVVQQDPRVRMPVRLRVRNDND